MINKTIWLSGLAAVAVLGAGATPILASAHGLDGSNRTAAKVAAEEKTKPARTSALAAALGIDESVFEAGLKAAAEATPKPDDKKDRAAREAYQLAFNTNLAAALGISLDALTAAQAQLKADGATRKDERRADADEKASRHFAQVLERLVTAGVLTQAQAAEALAQYQLGGEAQGQVVKRIRALLHDEKAEAQFVKMLDRLVGAGLLTQAQADEALAQYNLGGEPKGQIIKRLRALINDQKSQERGERTRARDAGPKREQRENKAGKKPAIESRADSRR